MYIVESTVEELKEEFPVVEDWISYICFYILNKRKEDCKISIFYHYGFFVPKSKNKGFYDLIFYFLMNLIFYEFPEQSIV
jgi:hypothetical protein